MAVSSEGLAIYPSLGDGIDGLVTVETEELRYNSGRGYLDEDDVIKTDSVERVEESKATLNFVCLDHCLQNVAYCEGLTLASEMVCDRKNGSQVIGRMTPYPGPLVTEAQDPGRENQHSAARKQSL